MRKIKISLIALCIVGSFGFQNVYGAFVDKVTISDYDNTIVTITGEIKDNNEERQVFFSFLSDSVKIDKQEEFTAKDGHITFIPVDKDGKYTYSFKLDCESGEYNVFAKYENSIYEGKFNFVTKAQTDKFIEDLGNKKIKEEEIFDLLLKYSQNLGISLSDFKEKEDIKRLNERIILKSEEIKTQKAQGIANIVSFVQGENKLISELKKTAVYTSVYKLLSDTVLITQIDFTKYNSSLNEENKKNVCLEFVGKEFSNATAIKTFFDEKVLEFSQTDNSQPSYSQGGGGGGGSSNRVFDNEPLSQTKENAEIFDDIKNVDWAYDAIMFLSQKNIINGIGNKKFDPNGYLTREQFAKIVALTYNLKADDTTTKFTDVSKDDWFSPFVTATNKAGIINGINNSEFGVGGNITREDVAVILYRAETQNKRKFENKKEDFSDFQEISDYAKDAVSYLKADGIINGKNDNMFMPKSYITRAETAKLIYTLIGGAI